MNEERQSIFHPACVFQIILLLEVVGLVFYASALALYISLDVPFDSVCWHEGAPSVRQRNSSNTQKVDTRNTRHRTIYIVIQ